MASARRFESRNSRSAPNVIPCLNRLTSGRGEIFRAFVQSPPEKEYPMRNPRELLAESAIVWVLTPEETINVPARPVRNNLIRCDIFALYGFSSTTDPT